MVPLFILGGNPGPSPLPMGGVPRSMREERFILAQDGPVTQTSADPSAVLCLPYSVRPLPTMHFSKWLLHVAWPLAVSQAREVHGTYMAAQAC